MSYNGTPSRFRDFCETNSSSPFERDLATPHATALDHIPAPANANQMDSENNARSLKCCCGRPACAYLEHNSVALGGLERDLETAARLGQALLARHESYMAESEAERKVMADSIASLEREKHQLQTASEKIVAENRELLDKLEDMNNSIANSDVLVKNLEATLAHAQDEVRRLINLAARTEDLERQLMEMEVSRAKIAEELDTTREEKSSALSRWREAEMKVRHLGDEVARIEVEAQREHERHKDLVGRMQRQKMVETELESAAGRLKGSAATNALPNGSGNKNVVSSFVKDILQDNANLQAGIVELRELLQASNEEVQNMREQVLQHQPLSTDEASMLGSLEEHLLWSTPKPASQEVHVHHHYHAKLTTPKTKATVVRRNSRKRSQIGLLASTPESTTPSTPQGRPHRYASSPVMPALSLSQQAVSKNRWSAHSATTGSSNLSSAPESPQSYFERHASIFDRLEQGTESSRPTSPESADFSPPRPEWQQRKGRPSDFSLSSFDEMQEEAAGLGILDMDRTPQPPQTEIVTSHDGRVDHDSMEETVILRPPHPAPTDTKSHPDQAPEPTASTVDPHNTDSSFNPQSQHLLHRTSSHDSLLSISGMDIHLAKRQPSQIFVLTRGISTNHFNSRSPTKPPPTSAAQPLATVAEVTATHHSSHRAVSSGTASNSSVALLSGLAGASNTPNPHQPRGLGRLVGGWVKSNWGVAPMKSTSDLRSHAHLPVQVQAQASPARPMGINQKGAIPGLHPPLRTPVAVHARALDVGLLSESLRE